MITINKWFSKNAKRPLFLLGLGTIFVQLCFISYIFMVQSKNQTNSVENLFTIANLALEQKNRPVLESTFDLAIEELEAKHIFLCHNTKTIMALPLGPFDCNNLPKTNILIRELKFNAIGRPDYQFHFFLPVLHLSKSYLILFGTTLIFFVLSLMIILKIQKRFSEDILGPLENNLLSDDNTINITQLEQLRNKIKEVQETKEKEAAASAILEHKTKVAHNIRSLVQTLKSLQSSIQEKLTPVKKNLFNSVVEGIGNILTEFSTKGDIQKADSSFSTDEAFFNNLNEINKKRSKIEITDVIRSVVKQKKYELQSIDSSLSIPCTIDDDLNYCFIDVDETEFRSILSNIINNAFEAKITATIHKKIKVNVSKLNDQIEIRISDNGPGISGEIKNSIFNRGITFGKPNGTGYGLFHAKSFLNSWDGNIEIESTSSKGTTAFVKIPCWKPRPFKLNNGDTVVILDDDTLIHEIWKTHLDSWKKNTGHAVQVKFFLDPVKAEEWISNSDIDYSKTIFFIDNDLGKEFKTGSSLINNLGIEEISTLVTNRYDDKKLNRFCRENNINLLPKPCLFTSCQILL